MLAGLVKLVLQQGLLSQHGVFDNQLEQAGDVETIEVIRFGRADQGVQQIALTLFIADRAVRMQFGFAHLHRQFTTLCQQGQQFHIQCADAFAQHE
ncbi:hypothetical protein D3C75_780990 [compost metagenome]